MTLIHNHFSYNGIGFNTGLTLFNANSINNSIKQAKYNVLATKEDAAYMENQVGLLVAGAYIQYSFFRRKIGKCQKTTRIKSKPIKTD